MPRRVTFGLINTFGNPSEWHQSWHERYEQILEQTEWIDRSLPIDGVYVTEHHFYDDGYLPSPLVMCAAIAARTKRISIGTNLAQIPLHHSVRFAEDALVVDALSGGRLRIGIGMGYYRQEFEGLGVALDSRVGRTVEGVAILRSAFSGKPFSFTGKRYVIPEIKVTPPPVRPGGPQLWMGAFHPHAVERAAQLADGFLAFDLGTMDEYIRACNQLGRPAAEQRINCTYWAIIADDPEREFARVGRHWLHLLNQYIVRDAYSGRQPPLSIPYDDPKKALADGLVMLADAAGAIKEFNRVIEKGAIDINLVALMPGEAIEQFAERLEYLCSRVIPFVDQSNHPALNF
jgi:alkanesulfonate monooxygenase SsuD/methylene tetrahydromethanopterin reductase-like flavin-dependent oxidoreductase (luciferase family)